MKSKIDNICNPKILICIPSYTKMDASFVQSLMSLNKPGNCSVQFITNTLIDEARNTFAEEAIELGYDYVFFMDTDMTFPSNALGVLLSDNKDIVSGIYFKRVTPFNPLIYKTFELTEDGMCFEDFGNEYKKDELQKVEGCGAGCLLIKTKVLKHMFDVGTSPFGIISGIGEDFSFCLRAKQLGYNIYCDSRVKCGHVASFEVNEENWQSLAEMNN